jgi:hypothetical protein
LIGASAVLFARPVAGGPERQVLDSMLPNIHQYFPVEDGIYYVARPDQKLPFAFELRFFSLATATDETLSRFEARLGTGLTVSPDRKTILYSGTRPSASNANPELPLRQAISRRFWKSPSHFLDFALDERISERVQLRRGSSQPSAVQSGTHAHRDGIERLPGSIGPEHFVRANLRLYSIDRHPAT